MPELLELTTQSVTATELVINVKNSSGTSLDKTLAIEIYPPMSLVSAAINDAAVKAADSEEPPGATRLDKIVTGPDGWSVFARRESSDSTPIIVVINDRDQSTGDQITPPVKFPAGAEATIRIPLSGEARPDTIDVRYGYTHGDPTTRYDGKLELKSNEVSNYKIEVSLSTNHATPTAIKAGEAAKVIWHIKDGVSAILRGPLPGDNSEISLKPEPDADLKLADGSISVRVVGLMNFILQAEVKPPSGPNIQVVKMLTLDTKTRVAPYIAAREPKVLRYGVIELDWAAWGVERVEITAGSTTRVIKLTEQTFGGTFEGTGVMRVTATKAETETVLIQGKPNGSSKAETVLVTTWDSMVKPNVAGHPCGMAVIAPKLALLTLQGLYIADVLKRDPSPALKELKFVKKTEAVAGMEWFAITDLGGKFVCLRRIDPSPDLEIASFNIDGTSDVIPPVRLPTDLTQLALQAHAVFDFVSFGERAYLVVEAQVARARVRRAYSVGFNRTTNKADVRPEPRLEVLFGHRLVTFDDALYALHRDSGQMFRFELTRAGQLGPPLQAASAVRRERGVETSLIKDGLIVPIGRVLVVLNPTAVPSLDSIREFDLHNVLGYTTEEPPTTSVPQDLAYNPQKNYWAPCGRDLTVKRGAVAAFRDGESPRLWVYHPDGTLDTLAVGSESLFVRDYALNFPTKPLSPYLNKKRKFTIKSLTGAFGPIEEKYRRHGLTEISVAGPVETFPVPGRQVQFDVELSYHEANPAPITLRFQLVRNMKSRADVDYLLELTFSGPNLSVATSCIRRLSIAHGRLWNDEVFGSSTKHSTDAIIEVPRPARFDEHLRFVIVDASDRLRLKLNPILAGGPSYITDYAFLPINSDTPNFTLKFDGPVATEGVIDVNLNFALPHGIEASRDSEAQTKMIRLDTTSAQRMQVKLVQLLMPGDPPLQLQGATKLIEPMSDRPVLVCQLDYNFGINPR